MEARLAYGFHVAPGSLRAVAISGSGKYFVCGGEDEVIRIFDMQTNKSCGDLSATHKGSITALQFFQDSFLLSASDDCTVCIWRISDWSCIHILGGHKRAVNGLSIHPSGKLALSVSKDNTMKVSESTYIHTYMHTCVHTYIHTYVHTYIHTYMHTYIHAYMLQYPS